jgi:hypothetical protein
VTSQPEPDGAFQDSVGQQFGLTESVLSSTWSLRRIQSADILGYLIVAIPDRVSSSAMASSLSFLSQLVASVPLQGSNYSPEWMDSLRLKKTATKINHEMQSISFRQ